MKFGLIGEKLGHSFSAEIHSKIADYEYELKELPRDDVKAFIEAREFTGINVTIPYKQTVMPYLDYIDEQALAIGAVNTIVNKDGKLFGFNTDFGGLLSLIQKKTRDLAGRKALILGDGGTSHTAEAVLKHLGCSEIYVVSLFPDDTKISYADAERLHSDADVILNATPVGMYPKVKGMAISIENFNNLKLVVDVVYNPLRTDLLIAAEKKGIPAISGLYMLVSQAVLAAGHFTGKQFTGEVTDRIYNEMVSKKRNIVLTGMPGSGKSTIGRVLAEKLGVKFIDTDCEIVKIDGREITDIFSQLGESGFRDIESEVIEKVSLCDGCVIATGGGAVLRDDNIRNLKHNGIIFFLDRDLEELIPTCDRPTANSKESIIKRYNERIDIYNSTNDYKVPVIGPDATADLICDILKELN